MNFKLLIGISVFVIPVIGLISVLLLEDNSINPVKTDSSIQPYFGGNSFSGGNMVFFEKWCVENNGIWDEIDDRCGFETESDHKLARVALDKLEHPEISGDIAQKICKFLDISCPDHAVFTGSYDSTEGKTFVPYNHKGLNYMFDVTDSEIKYRIGDSQEWFILENEN